MAALILRIAASPALELGLILVIAYTPWGNQLFGSAPIGWDVWLFAPPSPWPWWRLEEGRKALPRRGRGTRTGAQGA